MASRVASRYLEATRIPQIEQNTSPEVLSKGKGLSVTLARVDKANLLWLFDVAGSGPTPYRVRVQIVPPKGNVKDMSKVDVRLSCSCPFWQWQGPEYHAKTHDFLYGKPVGTATRPDVKDPKGKNWMCKHVFAALERTKTYDVPSQSALKISPRLAALRYLCRVLVDNPLQFKVESSL
jgi:hypothetical protein